MWVLCLAKLTCKVHHHHRGERCWVLVLRHLLVLITWLEAGALTDLKPVCLYINVLDAFLLVRGDAGPHEIKAAAPFPLGSYRIPMELLCSLFPWDSGLSHSLGPEILSGRVTLLCPLPGAPLRFRAVFCGSFFSIGQNMGRGRKSPKILSNSTLMNHPLWGLPQLISHVRMCLDVFESHLAWDGILTWEIWDDSFLLQRRIWSLENLSGNEPEGQEMGRHLARARKEEDRGERRRGREKLWKVWVWEILEQLWGVREWGGRGKGLLRNAAVGYKLNPLNPL